MNTRLRTRLRQHIRTCCSWLNYHFRILPETILKFADDTKVYAEVVNQRSREALQNDLDLLVKWSDEWQMKFNVQKCKVMHIGKITWNINIP